MTKFFAILGFILLTLSAKGQCVGCGGCMYMVVSDTFQKGPDLTFLTEAIKPKQINQFFKFCKDSKTIVNSISVSNGRTVRREYQLEFKSSRTITLPNGERLQELSYSSVANPLLYIKVYLSENGKTIRRIATINILEGNTKAVLYSANISETAKIKGGRYE